MRVAEGELDRVRLAERLAIVDEVHNDVAHQLAVAAIHLGLLEPEGRGRAAGAPGIAQSACQRALDGVRRARRMAVPDADGAHDPESVADDLGHLRELASACGATVVVAGSLPAAADFGAGVLLTAARTAEAFLRITAGHAAVVTVGLRSGRLCIATESALPAEAWSARDADVTRIRERMRWFDGRLVVTPHGGGSRAFAELPW